jgi:beta-phosphoglucomutase family hydrolase
VHGMVISIKAVIFDLDGVIAETERAHIQAEKETMLKNGVQISEDELHRYTGTTAKQMFTDLIKKYNLPVTFEEIFRQKEEIMFKLIEKQIQPTKGVIVLILKLKQRGIRLGIGSSSHRRLIEFVLKKLNIASLFDAVVGAEDIVNSKPDPETFLTCAKRLRVSPHACLVVEDAKLGIEAAKSAGMKCLGYRNPDSGNQDLSKADIVTDDFSKLDVQYLISL